MKELVYIKDDQKVIIGAPIINYKGEKNVILEETKKYLILNKAIQEGENDFETFYTIINKNTKEVVKEGFDIDYEILFETLMIKDGHSCLLLSDINENRIELNNCEYYDKFGIYLFMKFITEDSSDEVDVINLNTTQIITEKTPISILAQSKYITVIEVPNGDCKDIKLIYYSKSMNNTDKNKEEIKIKNIESEIMVDGESYILYDLSITNSQYKLIYESQNRDKNIIRYFSIPDDIIIEGELMEFIVDEERLSGYLNYTEEVIEVKHCFIDKAGNINIEYQNLDQSQDEFNIMNFSSFKKYKLESLDEYLAKK